MILAVAAHANKLLTRSLIPLRITTQSTKPSCKHCGLVLLCCHANKISNFSRYKFDFFFLYIRSKMLSLFLNDIIFKIDWLECYSILLIWNFLYHFKKYQSPFLLFKFSFFLIHLWMSMLTLFTTHLAVNTDLTVTFISYTLHTHCDPFLIKISEHMLFF